MTPDCIINYWPPWFRALCLVDGQLPRTYCCIDVETTGFSLDRDVITEWGHCLVVDGEVADALSLVVDWTGHPVVPDHWLAARLDALRTNMRLNGAECHMSVGRMKAEGHPPAKALAFVRDFTARIKAQGIPFVAHNGLFDEGMISANLQGFEVAPGFSFGDNGWIDTEAIEKASQRPQNERVHPRPGDTLRAYWHRVKYTRLEGVKSSLGDHCHAKYDFAGKGYPREKMHGAGADAACTRLLFEEFRKLVTPGPPREAVYPSADTKDRRAGRPAAPPAPAAGPFPRVRGVRRS